MTWNSSIILLKKKLSISARDSTWLSMPPSSQAFSNLIIFLGFPSWLPSGFANGRHQTWADLQGSIQVDGLLQQRLIACLGPAITSNHNQSMWMSLSLQLEVQVGPSMSLSMKAGPGLTQYRLPVSKSSKSMPVSRIVCWQIAIPYLSWWSHYHQSHDAVGLSGFNLPSSWWRGCWLGWLVHDWSVIIVDDCQSLWCTDVYL